MPRSSRRENSSREMRRLIIERDKLWLKLMPRSSNSETKLTSFNFKPSKAQSLKSYPTVSLTVGYDFSLSGWEGVEVKEV